MAIQKPRKPRVLGRQIITIPSVLPLTAKRAIARERTVKAETGVRKLKKHIIL